MWQYQYRWVFNPYFGIYQLQLVPVWVPIAYPVAVVPVAYGYGYGW